MVDSVATALRQELVTTKNSLTEVLDEVVYFEQQCARASAFSENLYVINAHTRHYWCLLCAFFVHPAEGGGGSTPPLSSPLSRAADGCINIITESRSRTQAAADRQGRRPRLAARCSASATAG